MQVIWEECRRVTDEKNVVQISAKSVRSSTETHQGRHAHLTLTHGGTTTLQYTTVHYNFSYYYLSWYLGSRIYFGLQKKLRSQKIYPRTKCIRCKSLIGPLALNGNEMSIMLEKDMHGLEILCASPSSLMTCRGTGSDSEWSTKSLLKSTANPLVWK